MVDLLAEVLAEQDIAFDDAVPAVVVDRGELTLHVAREHLLAVCRALRDEQDLRFELGLGVSGVHYPHETGPRAARGVPPDLGHPLAAAAAGGRGARVRPAHPVVHAGVPRS